MINKTAAGVRGNNSRKTKAWSPPYEYGLGPSSDDSHLLGAWIVSSIMGRLNWLQSVEIQKPDEVVNK